MDQATELRVLVRNAAPRRAPSGARGSRLVVFGGKGGVGATTIAVNIAAALAQHGERCLLCDAAGGDVALQLRLDPRHTVSDVLAGNRRVEEAIVPGPAGMQVLPSARDLLGKQDTAEHAWKGLLAHLPALAFGPETVVIDAGNRPSALARLLWQGAGRVLLVSTAETAAIMNAYASMKLLNDPARPASIALLLNRSPGDPQAGAPAADEAQRRLAHACRRFLGVPLRSVGAVPEDSRVPQCAARGEAFVLAAPACAASLVLRQAARALANRTAPRKPVAA